MSSKSNLSEKIEYLKQIEDKQLFLYEPLMNFNNIYIKEDEDINNYTSQIYNIIQKINNEKKIIYLCDDESSKLIYLKSCIEVIKFYYRHKTYNELFCIDIKGGDKALLKSTVRKLEHITYLNDVYDNKKKEIEENIEQTRKNCFMLIYNCEWQDLLDINIFSLLNNNSSYIIICEKEKCIYDKNIYDFSQTAKKKQKDIFESPLNFSENIVDLNTKYTFLEERNNDGLIYSYTVINNISKIKYIIDFIQKEKESFPDDEINALKKLSKIDNPYILKFIENGRGNILINNTLFENRPYIIFEYASKYNLFDYLLLKPFPELYSKLIFKKVLEGVKAIHDVNLCHRNINTNNILFDEDFNPKIYGFDLCCENREDLQKIGENLINKAPELYHKSKNDGQKLDIHYLGELLSSLIFGRDNTLHLKNEEKLYRIKLGSDNLRNFTDYKPTESFEKLLFKLRPTINKKPTINEILNNDWLKEINNLGNDEIENLENEIRNEFEKRRLIIKKYDDLYSGIEKK